MQMNKCEVRRSGDDVTFLLITNLVVQFASVKLMVSLSWLLLRDTWMYNLNHSALELPGFWKKNAQRNCSIQCLHPQNMNNTYKCKSLHLKPVRELPYEQYLCWRLCFCGRRTYAEHWVEFTGQLEVTWSLTETIQDKEPRLIVSLSVRVCVCMWLTRVCVSTPVCRIDPRPLAHSMHRSCLILSA